MNTEDDTFNTLKRLPFDRLCIVISDWITNNDDQRKIGDILVAYGWNQEEYDKFYRAHIDG